MGRKIAGFVSFVILLSLVYLAFGQTPAPPTGVTIGTAPTRYALTVSKDGTGLGMVTGMGITCGTDCSQSLNPLTQVELTATAITGSVFESWAGDCVNVVDNVCFLSMDAAKNAAATFNIAEFAAAVTQSGTGLGTVTSNPAGINCGATCINNFDYATSVILTATPTPPSVFTAWTGDCVSAVTTCSLSMTTDRNVNAQFTLPPTNFILTVTKPGNGVGTVTSLPSGINCGATCSASFADATVVTLTGMASGGSTFDGWFGEGCSGTGTCVVTMSQVRNVTATFSFIPVAGCDPPFATTVAVTDFVAVAAAVANTTYTTVCLTGTASWTQGLTINRPMTLKGASPCIGMTFEAVDGVANARPTSIWTSCPTVITDNYAVSGGNLITVTSGGVIIRDLNLKNGTGPLDAQPDFLIEVFATTGIPVVVRNNKFDIGSHNAIGWRSNRGVVSRNSIQGTVGGTSCLNAASFIRHKQPSNPDIPWDSPTIIGTQDTNGDQNLYIESNWMEDVLQNVDADDNAREYVRYNRAVDVSFGGHGTETGGGAGNRHRVLYGNRFSKDLSDTRHGGCTNSPPHAVNMELFTHVKGGMMFLANNVIPDINDSWGNKQEVVMFAEHLTRADSTFACWSKPGELIQSWPIPHQVGWGYTCLNPIAGQPCPLDPHTNPREFDPTDTWGSTTKPNGTQYLQNPEPVYIFGNTGGGNYANPSIRAYTACSIIDSHSCATWGSPDEGVAACQSRPSSSLYIARDREYYLEEIQTVGSPQTTGVRIGTGAPTHACTPIVGYFNTATQIFYRCTATNTWTIYHQPYQYPHPLTSTP